MSLASRSAEIRNDFRPSIAIALSRRQLATLALGERVHSTCRVTLFERGEPRLLERFLAGSRRAQPELEVELVGARRGWTDSGDGNHQPGTDLDRQMKCYSPRAKRKIFDLSHLYAATPPRTSCTKLRNHNIELRSRARMLRMSACRSESPRRFAAADRRSSHPASAARKTPWSTSRRRANLWHAPAEILRASGLLTEP
jgi:hypothetical protein